MYISQSDTEQVIKDDQLQVLIRSNSNLFTTAAIRAQEEAASYLAPSFDVAAIFAETGEDRYSLLVMYVCDIAIYHLLAAINPRNINELRADRYNAALTWLKAARDGKVQTPMPPAADANGVPTDQSIAANSNYRPRLQW